MKKEEVPLVFTSQVEGIPQPTWRHRRFYELLEISPSFYQIYLYKKKKIGFEKIKHIESYKKVIEIYDLVGNIYWLPFEEWWRKGAYKLFEPTQSYQAIFKIDLKRSQDENCDLLKRYYDFYVNKLHQISPKIPFEKSKIQEQALNSRISLIKDLIFDKRGWGAGSPNNKTKIPNWFYAFVNHEKLLGRTSGASYEHIKPAIKFEKGVMGYIPEKVTKKTKKLMGDKPYLDRPYIRPIDIKNTSSPEANKAKRYFSMLVSKHKKEALYLAENAARGIFPSKEKKLKHYLDFDFHNLRTAKEFQPSYPKNKIFRVKFEDMYVTGSNTRSKRKLFEDRWNKMQTNHEMLESVDSVFKDEISQKALETVRTQHKNSIQELEKIDEQIKQASQELLKIQKELSIATIKKKITDQY